MARRVFFSFHYRDIMRVNIVRNSWRFRPGGDDVVFWDASLWESFKRQGTNTLRRIIDDALMNTSVTAVLIGPETCYRPWVRYEIEQSYLRGNGIVGVRIHSIPAPRAPSDLPGPDLWWIMQDIVRPKTFLETFMIQTNYRTYEWQAQDGYNNFDKWIDAAARAVGR